MTVLSKAACLQVTVSGVIFSVRRLTPEPRAILTLRSLSTPVYTFVTSCWPMLTRWMLGEPRLCAVKCQPECGWQAIGGGQYGWNNCKIIWSRKPLPRTLP